MIEEDYWSPESVKSKGNLITIPPPQMLTLIHTMRFAYVGTMILKELLNLRTVGGLIGVIKDTLGYHMIFLESQMKEEPFNTQAHPQ